MVYLGGSRALTALELLVHLTTPLSREKSYLLVGVDVPSSEISALPVALLPEAWRRAPPLRETQALGDDWLASNSSLGLWVPSAIVPEELNLLLNPLHPGMRQLRIDEPTPFRFDPRLVTPS